MSGFTKTELLLISIIFILLSIILYTQLYECFNDNDPKIIELKKKISIVFPKIMELKIYKSEGKSYTINKHKVYICLNDEKGEYYDDNMLIYVLLHEYSHVLCDEIGHTDKFHKIFDEIIVKAIEAGIYNKNITPIKNYCEYKN